MRFFLLFVFLFIGGCRPDSEPEIVCMVRGDMMGTEVSIKIKCPESQEAAAKKALAQAMAKMENQIATVSSWDEASQTSRINRQAGKAPVQIGAELMGILQKAREVSDLSKGAFDITFSPVGQLYKLRPILPVIPSDDEIAEALKRVDYHKLELDTAAGTAFLRERGMRIDLGGIAKGAVTDAAGRSLEASGFGCYLINAGGDLLVSTPEGHEEWVVTINDPKDPRGEGLGTVTVANGAIVTSGNYERMVEINGKRYHHIIDPRTGRTVEGCVSVTVIGPEATTADALATAFFVMGPVEGLALCNQIEGVDSFFVTPEFDFRFSDHFPKMDLAVQPEGVNGAANKATILKGTSNFASKAIYSSPLN